MRRQLASIHVCTVCLCCICLCARRTSVNARMYVYGVLSCDKLCKCVRREQDILKETRHIIEKREDGEREN